ncbi:hypothetical protein V3481_010535 [Fusarium oxysporum f. sp. vasinfectum]
MYKGTSPFDQPPDASKTVTSISVTACKPCLKGSSPNELATACRDFLARQLADPDSTHRPPRSGLWRRRVRFSNGRYHRPLPLCCIALISSMPTSTIEGGFIKMHNHHPKYC